MKFGLPLFGVQPAYYATVAKRAEEAGFESVWLSEHLVFPAEIPATYPYSKSGQPPMRPGTHLYDPWVALAFAAAQTEKNSPWHSGLHPATERPPYHRAGRYYIGPALEWTRHSGCRRRVAGGRVQSCGTEFQESWPTHRRNHTHSACTLERKGD